LPSGQRSFDLREFGDAAHKACVAVVGEVRPWAVDGGQWTGGGIDCADVAARNPAIDRDRRVEAHACWRLYGSGLYRWGDYGQRGQAQIVG